VLSTRNLVGAIHIVNSRIAMHRGSRSRCLGGASPQRRRKPSALVCVENLQPYRHQPSRLTSDSNLGSRFLILAFAGAHSATYSDNGTRDSAKVLKFRVFLCVLHTFLFLLGQDDEGKSFLLIALDFRLHAGLLL
jgi:hypothetical protein